MNAAKMTLVSTVVAAAFGLALGLAPAPATADPPNPGHNHDNTGSEGGTSFEVTLVGLLGPEGGTDDCLGTTDPPKLDAQFDLGCSVIMDGGLILNLATIAVRVRKNGMTDLLLFFTSGTVLFPLPNDTVYATDRLGATVVPGVPPVAFELLLDAVDDDLIKIHQPDKGDVVGQISVGSFFYEPID